MTITRSIRKTTDLLTVAKTAERTRWKVCRVIAVEPGVPMFGPDSGRSFLVVHGFNNGYVEVTAGTANNAVWISTEDASKVTVGPA